MAVAWLLADPFMQHVSQELSGITSLPPLVMDREKNDVSIVKMGKDRCLGKRSFFGFRENGAQWQLEIVCECFQWKLNMRKLWTKFFTGESFIGGPFSIVLLNYRRVSFCILGRTWPMVRWFVLLQGLLMFLQPCAETKLPHWSNSAIFLLGSLKIWDPQVHHLRWILKWKSSEFLGTEIFTKDTKRYTVKLIQNLQSWNFSISIHILHSVVASSFENTKYIFMYPLWTKHWAIVWKALCLRDHHGSPRVGIFRVMSPVHGCESHMSFSCNLKRCRNGGNPATATAAMLSIAALFNKPRVCNVNEVWVSCATVYSASCALLGHAWLVARPRFHLEAFQRARELQSEKAPRWSCGNFW